MRLFPPLLKKKNIQLFPQGKDLQEIWNFKTFVSRNEIRKYQRRCNCFRNRFLVNVDVISCVVVSCSLVVWSSIECLTILWGWNLKSYKNPASILSMNNAEKFPNTLNILRYSHRKIFKLRLAIFLTLYIWKG